MKLLHTADLHIGAGSEKSGKEKEKTILTQIVNIVCKERPDAVLITGDVFASAEPSADNKAMLEDFIAELIELKTVLFLIGGEKDAGAFAAFADKFAEKQGIYIEDGYGGSLKRVFLKDEWGPVDFVCMPFVENSSVSMVDRLAATPMTLDLMSRHVLLAHCIVTGEEQRLPELTDGETLEGMEKIPAAWLGAFDYVALGHTCIRQRIGNREIWYPGTPLFYADMEADKTGRVNLVYLGRKGDVSVKTAEISIFA